MEKKKVLQLIRVSTPGQAEDGRAGIAAQRMDNLRTVQANGLEIVRTIEMIDVKGADVLQSSGMKELFKLMELPEIHGVVAREFSRLMRPEDPADFVVLSKFLATRTLLYLPDMTLDFSTPGGYLLGIFKASMAGVEAREIRSRTNAAKEAKRLAGEHASGRTTLPFGVHYDRRLRKWSIDAIAASKVKTAFQMILRGEINLTKIGRTLGIPRTSLTYLLNNRTYIGERVYEWINDPHGHVLGPDGKRRYTKKIRRPQVQVVKINLEPLISKEDFDRVQQILELKRRSHWRSQAKPRPSFTYAGFLWCSRCGSPLYGHTAIKAHYVCKSCTTRDRRRRRREGLPPCDFGYVLRDKLEASLDDLIGVRLLQRSFLKTVVARLRAALMEKQYLGPDVPAIQRQIESLQGRRLRVWLDFNASEGRMTPAEANQLVDRIDAELETTTRMLAQAGEAESVQRVLDLELLRRVLRPLCNWKRLTEQEKIGLLRQLGARIVVDRYTIKEIRFQSTEIPTDGDDDSRLKTAASPSRARLCR